MTFKKLLSWDGALWLWPLPILFSVVVNLNSKEQEYRYNDSNYRNQPFHLFAANIQRIWGRVDV
jgi:hypothetical protein